MEMFEIKTRKQNWSNEFKSINNHANETLNLMHENIKQKRKKKQNIFSFLLNIQQNSLELMEKIFAEPVQATENSLIIYFKLKLRFSTDEIIQQKKKTKKLDRLMETC